MITELLDKIDGFMYYPVLIVVMAIDSLKDCEWQKKEGKNPVFYGKNIGLNEDEPD